MDRLEALALTLSNLNGFSDPQSVAFCNANPGMLKAYSLKQAMNADQLRVFGSFLDGYQALLFDLKIKLSGKSRTKLGLHNSLLDLLRVYGHADSAPALRFLRHALHDPQINDKTTLLYFTLSE